MFAGATWGVGQVPVGTHIQVWPVGFGVTIVEVFAKLNGGWAAGCDGGMPSVEGGSVGNASCLSKS